MIIDINYKADEFKVKLSNIDTIISNLISNPDCYNTNNSYENYLQTENRED